jgi:putative ABC transport system permease protein
MEFAIGIDHNNMISVVPQFYDSSINVSQSIIDDHQRISKIPGVTGVSTVSEVPFSAFGYTPMYLSLDEGAKEYQANSFNGDKNMQQVLGFTLLEGRYFYDNEFVQGNANDIESQPSVVMISEDMAKALFDDQSAIGQTIYLSDGVSMQVIGVYSNFMNGEYLNYFGKSYQTILRPLVSWRNGADPKYIVSTDPGIAPNILEDITDAIYQTDGRYLTRVEVLSRVQKRMYDGRGSRAVMLLGISVILLFITAFGMAGLVSFLVNQRKRQIGTRRALGATKWNVVIYFMTENAILSLAGLALGMVLSVWLSVVLIEEAGVDFLNLGYVAFTAFFIFSVNQIAVYLPAKNAANVAPAIVTRSA